MLFSSPIFLFLFLPITLLGYYLAPKRVQNYWLLLASLIFFAWGGVSYTFILIGSIIVNYFFGLAIEKNLNTKKAYWCAYFGVTINILILGIFKYANFFTKNLNELFETFKLPEIPETNILLPIGISFYTFHSLSYLIDIYKRQTTAQRNIFDLSLYVCMFSQLVAGPIIRYKDVWMQLKTREHSLDKFSSGIERFIIGLGKKVLVANTFARVADTVFALNPAELNALNAWLGTVCYTLQIYYDFAGYSDMAIGLGRMFGFEFMENFNFPYIARSVKDFWRRWHISLSTFFRDYVYIPLGGNKVNTHRTYINLFLVFFLTGFWHGASWSFIVWGLFHGLFMIIERIGLEKILDKLPKPVAIFYTLLVVMFAWVLFRADTLSYAVKYWKSMFHFEQTAEQTSLFLSLVNIELIATFVIAILGAFGFFNFISQFIKKVLQSTKPVIWLFTYSYHTVCILVYAGIFALCTMYLIAGTYNPFIYYKF
ncbi:MAG: MBOAT family protein [Bacteroidetes bacterium]|nr:MBOAT family protein [Bacteroidota bacterium]